MFKRIFKSEDKRRLVNTSFDTSPTFAHKYNFEFSKKYIKNKRVLDIGCWTGQFEQLSASTVKEIVGIEPSSEAVKFAKGILPKSKFFVGKADKLPFSDAYFDAVVFFDVLEHLPKGTENKSLKEIHRVLKPNGTLIICTPYKHLLAILLDPAYFLIGHRHYSRNELSKMLTEESFKIKKIRVKGNALGLTYSIISLLFKHTLGFEPKHLQRAQGFLLGEHAKDGFAFIYVVAEAIKQH